MADLKTVMKKNHLNYCIPQWSSFGVLPSRNLKMSTKMGLSRTTCQPHAGPCRTALTNPMPFMPTQLTRPV
ncbi:hypothetical protein YC2023_068753 [Brassica napus]